MYPRGHRSAPGRILSGKYFPSKGNTDRKTLKFISNSQLPIKRNENILDQMPRFSSSEQEPSHNEAK